MPAEPQDLSTFLWELAALSNKYRYVIWGDDAVYVTLLEKDESVLKYTAGGGTELNVETQIGD